MAKLGNIAESFLDGFGCLGSIVEPCVRPGSQENLIQQDYPAATVELQLEDSRAASARRHIVWFFLASLVSSCVAAFFWFQGVIGLLRLNEVIAIAFCSQFVRELVELLMFHWKHSRRLSVTGEKASHRA